MIVCCGEGLIDFIPGETTTGEAAYVPAPGGSICNVAVGLGRLGVPTGFLGGVAADFFGEMLMERLRTSGVSDRYTARLPRPSTVAFVSLGGDEPEYVFYDEGAADRMWTLEDAPSLRDDVTALHFGSISLLREPAASAYADLMRREKGRRVLTLDPNLRPSLVKDEARYRSLLAELIGLADIVKISAADLAWWAPGEPFETIAGGWLDGGTRLVVVTRGAEGATAYWSGGTYHAPSVAVDRVQDAVGAGDSFMAGLLAGLSADGGLSERTLSALDESAIRQAVDLAVRVAAITVTRKGADLPTAEDLGR